MVVCVVAAICSHLVPSQRAAWTACHCRPVSSSTTPTPWSSPPHAAACCGSVCSAATPSTPPSGRSARPAPTHELRHTAASLAIASGADVKVVQPMLGHKTATMTLDLYGHLFPAGLDELADRFDDAVCAPDVPREPHDDDGEDDRRGGRGGYADHGPP